MISRIIKGKVYPPKLKAEVDIIEITRVVNLSFEI